MAVRNEEEIEKLVSEITVRAYRNVRAKLDEEAEAMVEKIVDLAWGCGCCADPRAEIRKQVIKILRLEGK